VGTGAGHVEALLFHISRDATIVIHTKCTLVSAASEGTPDLLVPDGAPPDKTCGLESR